ncbi:restriction endonuclease subunit S [Shewanella sp. AC91-MNA-CIBAN-0169]|uniref:restriction endonuclease subunit S n=1 Tax=Shewanella sp. AC91-MNA-CIBAN-0169 TaxID=3140466 RepID=UPI00332E2237
MADLSTSTHDSQSEQTADNLITQHIDIWTTAIERKSSAGRGTSNKFSLYGIKKLRELILELAVRGKLVPQDVNDEPASVLLERIAAEKKQLVKEGKLKKQKPLPEIGEDEKPFNLPQGWVWSRFQDISSYIQRGKGPSYAEVGKVKVISQKCVQNTGFDISPARYVTDESLEKYQAERFLINDDILWNSTGTGTVGRANVISNVDVNSLVADSHVTVIRPLNIYSRFLWCFIMAPGIQSRIEPDNENALVSGSTNQVELNTSSVMSVVAPVAPIEEQHRIVAKVDELMSLCDALEAQTEASISAHQTLVETLLNALLLPNTCQQKDSQSASPESSFADSLEHSLNDSFIDSWQRVAEHFDTLFITEASIDTLKQTILQLAVMGKLVPQASFAERNSPDYEPAAKLLKRIKAEKDQLIKDGKIKKQKIQAIGVDIDLYYLPEGWKWGQLGQLTASEDNAMCDGPFGSKLKTEHYINEKGFSVVRLGNIGAGKFLWGKEGHISKEHYETLPNNHIQTGDLIVAGMAEPLIRTCEVPPNLGPAVNKADCFRLRLHKSLEKKYISHYLNSHVAKQFASEENRGMTRQRINLGNCKALPVPIPPLEEQHRIVIRVDGLMALCDQLKARLADAQTTQLHLTDAIVEQAVN